METLLANFSGRTRRTVLNGRDFIIAPMTMLVEGVLNGSKGPAYYPADLVTNQALVNTWNGMPIVVYHPQDENGGFVSARRPDVAEKAEVGRVYNAETQSGERAKLRGEAWFDVEACNRVDKRIVLNLEAGRPIELSTGMGSATLVPVEGSANFNGKPYEYTVTNYSPDHLAVLPDMAGACSVSDGCGVLANQLSHADVRDQLWELLREKYPAKYDSDFKPVDYAYLTDVYDDFCVYERNGDLYKVGYSASDSGVTFKGEPEKVNRVVEYVPVNNSDPTAPVEEPNTMATKTEQVAYLVANCACWKGQEAALTSTPDAVLNGIYQAAVKPVDAPAATPAPAHVTAPVVNSQPAPVPVAQPVTPQVMSPQEWFSAMPESFKPVWNHAVEIEGRERTTLVAQLTNHLTDANQKQAAAQMFMGKPLNELRMLVNCMPKAVQPISTPFMPNSGGSTGFATPSFGLNPGEVFEPVANAQADQGDDEPLMLPVWNYEALQQEHRSRDAQRAAN